MAFLKSFSVAKAASPQQPAGITQLQAKTCFGLDVTHAGCWTSGRPPACWGHGARHVTFGTQTLKTSNQPRSCHWAGRRCTARAARPARRASFHVDEQRYCDRKMTNASAHLALAVGQVGGAQCAQHGRVGALLLGRPHDEAVHPQRQLVLRARQLAHDLQMVKMNIKGQTSSLHSSVKAVCTRSASLSSAPDSLRIQTTSVGLCNHDCVKLQRQLVLRAHQLPHDLLCGIEIHCTTSESSRPCLGPEESELVWHMIKSAMPRASTPLLRQSGGACGHTVRPFLAGATCTAER